MIQDVVESPNNCTFVVELDNPIEMKKLPKVDPSTLTHNPFTQELVIPVTEIISKVEYENVEGVLVNKVLYVEKTKKVSLYIHENSGSNIAGLSDKAQRLFLHILYTVDKGIDWYQFNKEHYMMRNKIKSETTVSNAITELCRYQYICKSHLRTVFWINPHRFFPGNRVLKYPDKIKVVQKWDQTI